MTNPVFDGLAEGLDPNFMPLREAAAISIAAKLNRLEKLQERAVEAAERQANALETMTALLASCIGVGNARCYADNARFGQEVPINYFRSGDGTQHFACDADDAETGND